MTILDALSTAISDRVKTNSLGSTMHIFESHNKHPKQNAFVGSLSFEITVKGVSSQSVRQDFSGLIRPVIVLYDDKRDLETRGQWDKIITNQEIRWIYSYGAGFEEEDLIDYILHETFELRDIEGDETVQVWKRIKVNV